MDLRFTNPILAGDNLARTAMQSPNYVAGSAGWFIGKNGNVEFNSGTFRGTVTGGAFDGTDFVINSAGAFFYSGTPALGNLIASIASAAGTDSFGNAYTSGQASYVSTGIAYVASAMQNGRFAFTANTTFGGAYATAGVISENFNDANMEFSGINLLSFEFLTLVAPSGSAVTDTANLAGILGSGNTPWLLPGTFDVNCNDPTLTALGPGQFILCSGDLNTIINAHGSGDLFYWSHTGSISDGSTTGGGLIGGATIDGTATTGNATGIHAGDINALRFDCRCQHFKAGTASWGFLFDNQNFFTERMHVDIRAKDCGNTAGNGGLVGFNVGGLTTSTGSFARLKGRIELTEGTNQQDGVVLNNGAHIYDHDLEIVGNFTAGASATTAAALRITGTVPAGHPGAGTHSSISNGRLNIGVECSSGANTPVTFVQGSSSNSVIDTYGNVNFNQNFTSSGITGAGWKFDGQVQGDSSLGTRRYYGETVPQTITANGQTVNSIEPSAVILVTAAANFTGLVLSPGDVTGQIIWLVNTGTGILTFAASGSNIAEGSLGINAERAQQLIWEPNTALWYPA